MNNKLQSQIGNIDDSSDESDKLSLSSTSEETDPQAEWPVKRILAEAKVKGVIKYLIEWDSYDLCEATWEPEENLGSDLLTQWRAEAEETGRVVVPHFELASWRRAVVDDIRAKHAKLEARSSRRARLGLEQRPLCTLQEWIDDIPGPSEEEIADIDSKHSKGLNLDRNETTDGDSIILAEADDDQGRQGGGSVGERPVSTPAGKSDPVPNQSHKTLIEPRTAATNSSVRRIPGSVKTKGRLTPFLPGKSVHTPPKHQAVVGSDAPNHSKSGPRDDTKHTSQPPKGAIPPKGPKGLQGNASASNIFIGGKRRKARRSLLDVATDESREPRLLNHRKRRLLEKASRDREGMTAPSRIPRADPPDAAPRIGDPVAESSPTGNGQGANGQGQEQNPRKSSLSDPQSPEKPMKKVRWADDVGHGEDESLFVPDVEPLLSSEGVEQNASVSTEAKQAHGGMPDLLPDSLPFHPPNPLQKMFKVCQFGPSEDVVERLDFSNLTAVDMTVDSASWLRSFKASSRLLFTHMCSISDLLSQTGYQMLQQFGVCQGSLSPAGWDTSKIDLVAKRLQVGRLAAICPLDGLSVAVFAKADLRWTTATTSRNKGLSIGSTLALAYSIFPSKPLCLQSMLAPLPDVPYPQGMLSAYNFFIGGGNERLFQGSRDKGTSQNFFLVFSPSFSQEAIMILHWLQIEKPNCTVRSSLQPGQWSEFLKLEGRTIILHEDALWTVRCMPNFSDLLDDHHGKADVWVFSQCRGPRWGNDFCLRYGDYRLRQAFPSGIVFLITPSFLVSQPEQAYNFVKFFWQNFTHHSPKYRLGKLAFCSDITDWLLDLANEKAAKPGVADARSDRASEARLKCWKLIRQLTEETEDYEDGPFVYAPEVLDGNDEQSLVNWFGSWSIMNLHHFRKFLVLGSSRQTAERLSRNLQPVQLVKPREHSASLSLDDRHTELDSSLSPSQAPSNQMAGIASKIHHHLITVEGGYASLSFCPIVLYRFPVTNKIPSTQARYGNERPLMNDFDKWFSFFSDAAIARRVPLPIGKNTYVGFFYTHEPSDTQTEVTTVLSESWSPWIVIFRPVQPQIKPWRTAEVFIWDSSTRRRFSGVDEIFEEALGASQRELLDFVRDKCREHEYSLPLDRVWLGPFDDYRDVDAVDPIEQTLAWIGELSGSIKQKLPLQGHQILSRGWKPVRAARHLHEAGQAESLPLRAVLRAPRVGFTEQPAVCRNYFQEAIHKSQPRVATPFTFKPTLKWYADQLKGGRGFHHISVAAWPSVFARYKIVDPEKE